MYSEMRKFWFWAHKVLPLVYDDSLSYYEVLCKVVAKLNECIDKINELGNELDEFEGWTREEFQKVRDEMAAEIRRIEGEISNLDSKVDREVNRLDTKIDTVESNLGSRITAVMANFCGGWIAGSSYNVGAIVRYGDTVRECITPNTDEEFDSSKWRATTIKAIMDDLATALRSEISDVMAMVAKTQDMIAPEYSVTGTYHKTQYVRYSGRLYKARTDIPYPAGDWDSSEWSEAPLSAQILRNYNLAYHCSEVLDIPAYSESQTYYTFDVVTHYYNGKDAIWVSKDGSDPGAWNQNDWLLFNTIEGAFQDFIKKFYILDNRVDVNFDSTTRLLLNLSHSIGMDYNENVTYNTGDYCVNDSGILYKCKADNVSGAWDSTKWDSVTITGELDDKANVSDIPAAVTVTMNGDVYIGSQLIRKVLTQAEYELLNPPDERVDYKIVDPVVTNIQSPQNLQSHLVDEIRDEIQEDMRSEINE